MTSLPQHVARWTALTLLFPWVAVKADNPVVEAEIVELARNDPGQQRAEIIVDPILSDAAQAKADDMLARNYLAHVDPDGCGPNFLVQSFGYFLPAGYGNTKTANNVESLFRDTGFGPANAQLAFDGWLSSPGHRTHVLGENGFFAQQIRVGVGVASDPEAEKNYYVFLSSAPAAAGDVHSPQVTYRLPKARSRPRKVMTHHGSAFDLVGIRQVQIRVSRKGFRPITFLPENGAWVGKTRVSGALFRKIREGRRALVVHVRVEDESGNGAGASRRFSNSRRR